MIAHERLEKVKSLIDEYWGSEDPFVQTDLGIEIIQGHVDFLIKQAERVRDLENELKTTINKKNRLLRTKDKQIKQLDWDNMVHRQAHGRLYTSHYSLQKELEEKGIKTEWKN